GSGNAVFAITASPIEYDTYIKLALEKPAILKSYVAYFGDAYLTNPKLIPPLDIATMFHAGEYISPTTTTPEYGGMDDLGLTRLLLDRMRPGGHVLFYTGSFAFDKAEAIVATLTGERKIERAGVFKSLLVCRKI